MKPSNCKGCARKPEPTLDDMEIVELLTIISVITRDLAKDILTTRLGQKGGVPNAYRTYKAFKGI